MKIAMVAAVVAVAAVLLSAPASAQVTGRTFVSGTGNDANPCSRTMPCRSFGAAIGLTSAGGEVVVLDTAGYGPVTISQAVTITADGVEAAITPTSGNDGIDVSAPAGAVVVLNGLVITGGGVGTNGINVSGGAVSIQNCVVRGFSNDGILLGAADNATVSDTILSGNGQHGAEFIPTAAASVSFERVQFLGNQNGFTVQTYSAGGGAVAASLEDTVFSGNPNVGLTTAGNATALLSNSQVFNNKYGIFVTGSSTVNLTQDTIFGNSSYGYYNNSGTINTFRTTVNNVNYNGNYIVDTTNNGSLTPVAPQ